MSYYKGRVELPDGDEDLFESEEELEEYKKGIAEVFDQYCKDFWKQVYGEDDDI